ncbi:single-stranded-DNA-specific exonuclease RecJ [Candidatus Vampirococcus lugosii]|uniref:Exonuclease RecJ n=1 Tax=Candidatus Vampirococcus lugosii TaxID=2789015 RepID=A0ABS5QMD7_9BACT|nr:DHH family phosphoesterase [Candidatus Vampirococcus lugosii]MBS8122332.1 exonuclease RecJ [Candidatus Vampirococcus lugosii]
MDIIYDNPNEDLLQRLLKIRKIDGSIDDFLNPTFTNSWIDPYLLNDFEIAIHRIQKAIKNNEKIVILGDYDVDGITSSFLLYKFFTIFLNYKKISIRLPNRLTDGYGMKKHHLDEIKSVGADLVITVDNGITCIKEAEYASKIGLDLIITDHHKALDQIPKTLAVVNPQISPNYSFKGIAGVGVAFKIASALIKIYIKDINRKKIALNYLLPIVAIGTVADCVPLLGENRLMTKMGIDYINTKKLIPKSISNFLSFLNIKNNIETFHIGFMIAPRINAGGRMQSPYDSLNCLIYSGDKQKKHLENIEKINNDRKKSQDDGYKEIDKIIDKSKKSFDSTIK